MVENQDIRALLRELASSVRGKKLTNYCLHVTVLKIIIIDEFNSNIQKNYLF